MYVYPRSHACMKLNKWEASYNIYTLINIVCTDGRDVALWEMNGLCVGGGGGPSTLFIFCRNINLQTSRLDLSTLKKLCYVPKWCVCYTRHILLVILFVKNTLDINIFGTS